MIDNNLSYIIDYLYQKHIEQYSNYIDCIYDLELLNRYYYIMEDMVINSRFIIPNKYIKYNYIPYDLSFNTIKKLSKFIEITKNNYSSDGISINLLNIKLDNSNILYYDKNKLLLNNNFLFNKDHLINNQISTAHLLIKLREHYG